MTGRPAPPEAAPYYSTYIDRIIASDNVLAAVRIASLSFLRNLPDEIWTRTGIAKGNPVSVRALAYIVAGHVAHHIAILRERYL